MMAREDAELDRARNSLTIYTEVQQGERCGDLANELFSAGQHVEELQRQLARERARTANVPPETTATHVEAEPVATPGPEADSPSGSDTSETENEEATDDDQPGSGTEGLKLKLVHLHRYS